MHHRLLARLSVIPLVPCPPLGALSLVVGTPNPPSLPAFICLANQPGHSHGDGSHPPRLPRKVDPLISMTLS